MHNTITVRFFRAFWFLFCGFMIVLWTHEFAMIKLHPEDYAPLWNGQGPVADLWPYRSETAYLLHLIGLMLWHLLGMALSLGKGPFQKGLPLAGHIALTVAWAATAMLEVG